MKALSIKQPWAELIVRGVKPLENRRWHTRYRGPLLIHAAKGWSKSGEAFARAHGIEIDRKKLERGGIVGRVQMVDCVTEHPSEYFSGPFAFVLSKAERLPFRPLRGRLCLFNVET